MIGAWHEEHLNEIVRAASQMRRLADQLREIGRPPPSVQTPAETSSPESCLAPSRETLKTAPGLPADYDEWAADRLHELGHIGTLVEVFSVEISAWEADMLVRGLVSWSRDPYWKPLDSDDVDILLGELRALEQRITVAIPEQTQAFYDHLQLSLLLEDEACPNKDVHRDSDDGL
jgi:hypothetical protein